VSIFELHLDQIDASVLTSLVSNAVREDRQLDYKEKLPGMKDEEKREFLSDVASFGNALGGDILYGIRERRDTEGKPTGEPDAIIGLPELNVDAERLRLESLIRDGIAPRVPQVGFTKVPQSTGPSCLLLRIPQSWVGPHMVTFRNDSRFYSRSSAGKYQLDIRQIRAGFLAAEATHERVRSFRSERISRIVAQDSPVLIGDGAKLVFHAVPLTDDTGAWHRFLSIRDDTARAYPLFPTTSGGSFGWRFNLDGFVVHTTSGNPSRESYTQMFRNGGIEIVRCGLIEPDPQYGGFFGINMEREIIQALKRLNRFWRQIAVEPPLVLGLTLYGVRNQKILVYPNPSFGPAGTFSREVVVVPDVVVDDLSNEADALLHPLFNYVWNGGGWEESPNYREGRWRDTP